MTEEKKTIRDSGGKFVKGGVGNPAGRPPMPEEIRKLRRLSPVMVAALISKYAQKTRDELQAIIKDRTTPALDLTLCTIIVKAMQDGDYTRLDFLLNRSIGKVVERVETTQPMINLTVASQLKHVPEEKLLDAIAEHVTIETATTIKEIEGE